MEMILTLENVGKQFISGGKMLSVLENVSFTLEKGASMSIVGPSGSGKTTLLGLCAGLDQPSAGSVMLLNSRLENLNEDALAALRGRHVGFIFQNFQLLPTLTAMENVMVPLELRGDRNVRSVALAFLEKVGLAERGHHYPAQLSGGEQQRVAIARAFSSSPDILFADEPTGNLDQETSEKIVDLIFSLNREAGTTLVMVTHDKELADKTQRILHLKGGRIFSDEYTQVSP